MFANGSQTSRLGHSRSGLRLPINRCAHRGKEPQQFYKHLTLTHGATNIEAQAGVRRAELEAFGEALAT